MFCPIIKNDCKRENCEFFCPEIVEHNKSCAMSVIAYAINYFQEIEKDKQYLNDNHLPPWSGR